MYGLRTASLALIGTVVIGYWLLPDKYVRQGKASADGSTIRFAHSGDYQDYELWRDVLSDFERGHPDVTVKQEYIVGLSGRYNTKMRQQVLTGSLPDVALVQLGPFHELASHFAGLSYLLEPSSSGPTVAAAGLDATALAAFRVGSKQRGLPVWGGNLQIFYNTECFERAGRFHGRRVPRPRDDWTMADFHRTAKLLTCDFDGDGRIDQFGFWLPRWVYYLPFLWSFGARITDDGAAEWRLVGPAAQRALSFYRTLAVDDHVCPKDEEVPQLFQDVGFLTGKVALCVNGPWFMPFLAKTRLADSYGVAPIPRGRAGRFTRVTWDGIVMARRLPPRRRRAAERFIAFVLSPTVQDRIAKAGRALPARIDAMKNFAPPEADPRRRRFVDALGYSRFQPRLPRFGEMDRVINEYLRRLIDPTRGWSAKTVLDQLASDRVVRSAFARSASKAQ